jgi:hypothetical protein
MAEEKEKKEKKGKRINCGKCNKPLKRVKRYYRNGKYYCNTKCFNDAAKKAEQPK